MYFNSFLLNFEVSYELGFTEKDLEIVGNLMFLSLENSDSEQFRFVKNCNASKRTRSLSGIPKSPSKEMQPLFCVQNDYLSKALT